MRLVRLWDKRGATRRAAALDEFDESNSTLLQKLGKDEFGWLVAVGEHSAELSHEALITQWPWLAERLNSGATDIRVLGRLMERANDWQRAPDDKKEDFLSTGAELDSFDELTGRHPDWLSATERRFVSASLVRERRDRRRTRQLQTGISVLLAVAALLVIGATIVLWRLATTQAQRNADELARLAASANNSGDYDRAARFALAGLHQADGLPFFRLDSGLLEDEARRAASFSTIVLSFGSSNDPARLVGASERGDLIVIAHGSRAELRSSANGALLHRLDGDPNVIKSAAFLADQHTVITQDEDEEYWIWDINSGKTLASRLHGVLTKAATLIVFEPSSADFIGRAVQSIPDLSKFERCEGIEGTNALVCHTIKLDENKGRERLNYLVDVDIQGGLKKYILPGAPIGAGLAGAYLAVWGSSDVKLLETFTGREIASIPASSAEHHLDAAVSEDGEKLFVLADDIVTIRNLRTGDTERRDYHKTYASWNDINQNKPHYKKLYLSPNARLLAVLNDNDEINFIDLTNGRTSYLVGAMDSFVFSRDSRFGAARSYPR